MSLIFDQTVPYIPDSGYPYVSSVMKFFDDFIGTSYDNQTWGTIGTGTITQLSQPCGRILVRATTGSTEFQFTQGNMGSFSSATTFMVAWRGQMIPPASGGGSVECGVEGAGDQATDWCDWYCSPTLYTNWQCRASDSGGGGEQIIDSGVPIDNNDHVFKIVGSSGVFEFSIDNILKVSLTAGITSSLLQPYTWLVANGTTPADFNIDYIAISGGRL